MVHYAWVPISKGLTFLGEAFFLPCLYLLSLFLHCLFLSCLHLSCFFVLFIFAPCYQSHRYRALWP